MIIEEMFVVEPDKDSLFCVNIVEGEALLFTRHELDMEGVMHSGRTATGVIEEFKRVKESFTNKLAFKDFSSGGELHGVLVHPKKFTVDRRMVLFVCILPESKYSALKIGDICD